jgi:hypothetical protein
MQYIREVADLGLADGKKLLDGILDGREVTFHVEGNRAEDVRFRLEEMGLVVARGGTGETAPDPN